MNEINKLVCLLAKANIAFELCPFPIGGECTLQICYPDKDTCKVDAVSHQYSYGGKDGLIEVLGSVNPDFPNYDVVGWLTAEEAFPYFVDKGNNESCS